MTNQLIRKVKLIYRDNWDQLFEELRGYRELGVSRVLIRDFSLDRLDVMKERGIDRDEESRIWAKGPNPFDFDHSKLERPLDPSVVLYGTAVDISKEPMMNESFTPDPEIFPFEEYTPRPFWGWENTALAIYNAEKLERKAPYEYWLNGDPRDALLFIYINRNNCE